MGVRKYPYSINRFLLEDAETHASVPDIPSDRMKNKEPPDKIDLDISVPLPPPFRDEKMGPPKIKT